MSKIHTRLKQKQILWRQYQVLDLAGDGFSEREIVTRLHISDRTIHMDIVYLRARPRKTFASTWMNSLPFELQKTLAGTPVSQTSQNGRLAIDGTVKVYRQIKPLDSGDINSYHS